MKGTSSKKKKKENPRNGGIDFNQQVYAPGSQFAGRDMHVNKTPGITTQDLDILFAPLMEAIRQAPVEKQAQVEATAGELKEEIAKGEKASDDHLGKLLENLLALVPEAAGAVLSLFAHPILAGLAGKITQDILAKLG